MTGGLLTTLSPRFLSFLPRIVELHTRGAHYAHDDLHGLYIKPKWESRSRNPAAMSVNAEARAAALEFYTISLPLYAPPLPTSFSLQKTDRVLYINLQQDTVVLLGNLHYPRVTRLLLWFRKMDKPTRASASAEAGKGLRRLAMSVSLWAHEVGAATLMAFARTDFAEMEEFVLFMYPDRPPPPEWKGGLCRFQEIASDTDYYRRFVIGRGRQFRRGDDWMVVGKRPMRVVDLSFEDAW